MNLEYANKTHIGTRPENQDYLGSSHIDPWYCFVVTDGCGAYPGSGLAAKYFCEIILDSLPALVDSLSHSPKPTIKTLFDTANERMNRLTAMAGYPEAQTTCAAAWLSEQHTVLAHIGDSRIYRISNEQCWHTKDHSWVQALIDNGDIAPEEALNHPDRHILSQTIGNNQPLKPAITVMPPLQVGETLILCTDGFWINCQQSQFFKLAESSNIQKLLNQYVLALVKTHRKDALSLDNVTVQVVRREENISSSSPSSSLSKIKATLTRILK